MRTMMMLHQEASQCLARKLTCDADQYRRKLIILTDPSMTALTSQAQWSG